MMFKILGGLLIAFGVADFALFQLADIDLTGLSWSPYAAGLAGSVVWGAGSKQD